MTAAKHGLPPAAPALAYLSLAASMALVGSYVGLSKVLVAAFPVFLLAWLRFGIAAVAMASWMRKPADEPLLSAHDRKLLFLESFLGNFLFSICMLFGVQWAGALAAGVVMAALPGAVALLSRNVLRERIAPRVMAGIVLAVAGIGLVALSRPATPTTAAAASSLAADRAGWGQLLLVAALLCEASYVVIGKRLTASLGPRRISAIVNLWGLALVTPFGLVQALSFDFAAVTAASWGLLLFYSLAASMVTVWLWMTGLRHVPAAHAGVFTVMLPITAASVGLALGEPFTAMLGLAFVLALAGLLLATWPGRAGEIPAPR